MVRCGDGGEKKSEFDQPDAPAVAAPETQGKGVDVKDGGGFALPHITVGQVSLCDLFPDVGVEAVVAVRDFDAGVGLGKDGECEQGEEGGEQDPGQELMV